MVAVTTNVAVDMAMVGVVATPHGVAITIATMVMATAIIMVVAVTTAADLRAAKSNGKNPAFVNWHSKLWPSCNSKESPRVNNLWKMPCAQSRSATTLTTTPTTTPSTTPTSAIEHKFLML